MIACFNIAILVMIGGYLLGDFYNPIHYEATFNLLYYSLALNVCNIFVIITHSAYLKYGKKHKLLEEGYAEP